MPRSGLADRCGKPAPNGSIVPSRRGLEFGHSAVDDAWMSSETNSAGKSGQESVVIASFDSYRHAEHMLASLGRGFRKKARKAGTTAVVVRGNPDGSLKVTESRVLSAGLGFKESLQHLVVAGLLWGFRWVWRVGVGSGW